MKPNATVTVSNIRLAEMMGAKSRKPSVPYILVNSKLGGIRYWPIQSGLVLRWLK